MWVHGIIIKDKGMEKNIYTYTQKARMNFIMMGSFLEIRNMDQV